MEPVTLRTPRFELFAPTGDDVDAIHAACQDADIQRYTTVPSPYPRSEAEAFVEKVRAQPEGDTKVALSLLCDLFALSTIESDRAWFMEHGRLSVARSKAISREIGSLCRTVRPLAADLVDAFAVPPAMLRSRDLLG